jgi:hypothetical protein
VPLISKAHRNTVLTESPNLFDQPVVEFAVPFAGQESDYGLPAHQKFSSVSPNTVRTISESDLSGIACVPGVFGFADLLDRTLKGKRQAAAAVGPSIISSRKRIEHAKNSAKCRRC